MAGDKFDTAQGEVIVAAAPESRFFEVDELLVLEAVSKLGSEPRLEGLRGLMSQTQLGVPKIQRILARFQREGLITSADIGWLLTARGDRVLRKRPED